MLVYQLGRDGEFVAVVSADIDPMEPGRYLIPGGCVTVPPPAFSPEERAVWRHLKVGEEGQWMIERRPLPPVEQRPADAPIPEDRPAFEKPVRNDKDFEFDREPTFSEKVNAERMARFHDGCVVRLDEKTAVVLTGDEETSKNLLGRVSAASIMIARGEASTLAPWRDAADVTHMLTPAQFQDLQLGSTQYVDALYAASWKIKAQGSSESIAEDPLWPSRVVDLSAAPDPEAAR